MLDVDAILHCPAEDTRIELVLELEDPLLQGVAIVAFQNRRSGLGENGARVTALVYQVNGRAADSNTLLEGLPLSIDTRKCRQERRVDVENAVGPGLDELRAQHPHVARAGYPVDPVLLESLCNDGLMGLSRGMRTRRQPSRPQAAQAQPPQAILSFVLSRLITNPVPRTFRDSEIWDIQEVHLQ